MRYGLLAVMALSMMMGAMTATAVETDGMWIYVGTYTGPKSKGIYQFRFDAETGKLTPAGLAGEATNPSFLAIHPSRKYLYAVGGAGGPGNKQHTVSAFSIDPATRKLTALNQQSSGGRGPCFVTVDSAGKNALVANYGSGSVAVLPIGADGKLAAPTCEIQHQGKSVDARRQQGSHAHSINLDPANRFAFAADLGLDKVLVYRFDGAKGALAANDPPAATVAPGSGPRHFAFHPTGRFAYVINEMANTVTAFAYDAEAGKLSEIQTITTLPADFKGTTYTAEVQVHPSGRFLYGSNRGHDSIAAFLIDPTTGKLTPIGHQSTGGKYPRNFGIDPTGRWLIAANQASNNLVVFRIDPETGALKETGIAAEAPSPVCVKFLK